MRKWTTTAGLLFCATASVYSSQVTGAKGTGPARAAEPPQPTDVKLLEEAVDPFGPGTQPSTVPSDLSTGTPAPPSPLEMNNDGTFSLNIVSGADLVEQLRVIGFQAQMSIIPSKEVRGGLPAIDLYDVTVTEALDALLHSNGYAWRQKGNFVYVYSAKEVQEMERATRVMGTEVFYLYYTPVANAVNMIKPVLSSEGQVSFTTAAISGIQSGASDVGGNSHATEDLMVVNDYPENLERIRVILKQVDRRPQQILVEATILRAALTEDNKLGVDFNIVGGVDFSTLTTSNGQITGANTPSPASPSASSVGTGNAFTGPIASGLKVGVVSNNVSIFLAALEGVTDTVILANPKVLALNKQKGEVIVGKKDGYITTTVTDTAQTQTVEFLDTGTRLIFRPFIGSDGYIRMEIHPEDSSGGVNALGLPSKFTTEVTSNVMVKDGHTIVIGGLFRESSTSARSQVPLLGNIPIAGHLFRNQNDQTTREEVIIMLTPHIVKDDNVYAQLADEQMRNAEQMRVGVRRGMMPWGRERMADLYYHSAVTELDKPNPDRKKAIFYLNAATGLNPTFMDAINLRQDLTGRELSTAHGSSIRGFVRKAMLVDHTPTEPLSDATLPAAVPVVLQPVPATEPVADNVLIRPEDEYAMELCEDCDPSDVLMPGGEPTLKNPLAQAGSAAPATQPAASKEPQSGSTFGISGLGSALGDMLKAKSEEKNSAATTVTELPLSRLTVTTGRYFPRVHRTAPVASGAASRQEGMVRG
jgi:type IV pilus assembly protein PilQ